MELHPEVGTRTTLDCHVFRLRVLTSICDQSLGLHTFARQFDNGFPATLVDPTYSSGSQYMEAEKLENQIPGAESPYTITTIANVQEVQDTQVLDAGSTVPGEENLELTQVVLNHPVQLVLSDITVNPEKNSMYLCNCCLDPV